MKLGASSAAGNRGHRRAARTVARPVAVEMEVAALDDGRHERRISRVRETEMANTFGADILIQARDPKMAELARAVLPDAHHSLNGSSTSTRREAGRAGGVARRPPAPFLSAPRARRARGVGHVLRDALWPSTRWCNRAGRRTG